MQEDVVAVHEVELWERGQRELGKCSSKKSAGRRYMATSELTVLSRECDRRKHLLQQNKEEASRLKLKARHHTLENVCIVQLKTDIEMNL